MVPLWQPRSLATAPALHDGERKGPLSGTSCFVFAPSPSCRRGRDPRIVAVGSQDAAAALPEKQALSESIVGASAAEAGSTGSFRFGLREGQVRSGQVRCITPPQALAAFSGANRSTGLRNAPIDFFDIDRPFRRTGAVPLVVVDTHAHVGQRSREPSVKWHSSTVELP